MYIRAEFDPHTTSANKTKQTSVIQNIILMEPPWSSGVLNIPTTAGGYHVITYKPALILCALWQIAEMSKDSATIISRSKQTEPDPQVVKAK